MTHAPAARPLRPAAFIDRDGVLNEDHGYVGRIEQFQWLPGAKAALARLQAAGYLLVVVTNQSGIARGYYTQADFDALTAHMREDLAQDGVTLAAVQFCPHLPDAQLAAYRVDCDCRKPRPGMILQAAEALGIDLAASCLFGDKPSDIAAGRSAGVGQCWLVGEAATSAAALAGEVPADGMQPDLAHAVAAMLTA
jgi:D-glycero-D-manno-heptose 1,7-bisphosphate phosphatase